MRIRRNVAIIGCSGHAHVAADILSLMAGVQIVGFLGDRELVGGLKYGFPVLGPPKHLSGLVSEGTVDAVLVAIGDNAIRARVAEKIIQQYGQTMFISAVHPASTVSTRSILGPACLVAAGAVIGPGSDVGFGSIVNTNASLDHDCVVGRYVSLAPNSVTGGNVVVGDYAAIGIGASVYHGVNVGADVVIGGGAVVTNDIEPSTVAFGVPAEVRSQRSHGDPYM